MIEDVGRGIEDDLDAPFLGVEVGNQDLDDDRGIHGANRFDRAGKMIRATIFQIISGDGGNDDVLQTHPAHGLGDALRFIFFQRKRPGGGHCAKSTGPGAALTRDHHRRGALAPTFPAVRALRAFADGVQPQVRDEGFRGKENRIRGQSNLDPWRFLRLVQRRIDFRAGHHGEAIRADEESNRGGTPWNVQLQTFTLRVFALSSRAAQTARDLAHAIDASTKAFAVHYQVRVPRRLRGSG